MVQFYRGCEHYCSSRVILPNEYSEGELQAEGKYFQSRGRFNQGTPSSCLFKEMGTMLSLTAIEREVVLLRYRRQGVPCRVSPFFVENLKKTTEANCRDLCCESILLALELM
jgi:hypothetical protein